MHLCVQNIAQVLQLSSPVLRRRNVVLFTCMSSCAPGVTCTPAIGCR